LRTLTVWNSEVWIWMDFETPGILAVKDTWEPGILGIMVETKTELKYCCVILDEKLENIANIYPEHCIYNPDLDFDLVLQHLSELDGFTEWVVDDPYHKSAFCWSDADIRYFDHFFGHHWDGRTRSSTYREDSKESFFGDTDIHCTNVLPNCKRLGRKMYGMKRPHSLERYFDLLDIEHPSGGKASNIIRELKSNWWDPKWQISERDRVLARELVQYNYYDCFGLRCVMSRLHQEAEEGTFFPNPDFLPHPDFSLD